MSSATIETQAHVGDDNDDETSKLSITTRGRATSYLESLAKWIKLSEILTCSSTRFSSAYLCFAMVGQITGRFVILYYLPPMP